MNSYTISTVRLGLREWTAADVRPFVEMNKDRDVMEFFPATLSENETLELVQKYKSYFDEKKFGRYVVEEKSTKKFIGFTGFGKPRFESFFTPCIEIGWRFKREGWGKGYATEAARACLNYGFEMIGLATVYSFTAIINERSENVMKKIGMTKVAEFDHPKIEPTDRL